MRTELPELGLSLELPARWREFTRGGGSAAFGPEEHAALPAPELQEGLYLKAEGGDELGLDIWAETAMAGHVRQGHPDWEELDVAGSRARIASWTDGVLDVLTTFIVRGRVRVLVELWGKGLQPMCSQTIDEELRSLLGRVLESVEWTATPD